MQRWLSPSPLICLTGTPEPPHLLSSCCCEGRPFPFGRFTHVVAPRTSLAIGAVGIGAGCQRQRILLH